MFYACMHSMFLLPINQLELATATRQFFFRMQIWLFCNVYCLVPNIRYWPNIRKHFLAEYSFLAETRKSISSHFQDENCSKTQFFLFCPHFSCFPFLGIRKRIEKDTSACLFINVASILHSKSVLNDFCTWCRRRGEMTRGKSDTKVPISSNATSRAGINLGQSLFGGQ
jgi:hypothetical protein